MTLNCEDKREDSLRLRIDLGGSAEHFSREVWLTASDFEAALDTTGVIDDATVRFVIITQMQAYRVVFVKAITLELLFCLPIWC